MIERKPATIQRKPVAAAAAQPVANKPILPPNPGPKPFSPAKKVDHSTLTAGAMQDPVAPVINILAAGHRVRDVEKISLQNTGDADDIEEIDKAAMEFFNKKK